MLSFLQLNQLTEMFSVIIPLYNKAPYITKAIQSVLDQTFSDFELIVIDDGSTDGGEEIAESVLKNTSISFQVIRQTNQGVSIARNNGVKAANFEFIAFLDADDWWEPTFLEEMNRLRLNYPDAGIWASSYYIVKNGRRRIAPIGVESDFVQGEIDYYSVYAKTLCMPVCNGAIVIPKSVIIASGGFKQSLKLGEDFDLWVRIVQKHSVVLLNKPLSSYNQDVNLKNRAIGEKLYEPSEHMLFTDYGKLMKNAEFNYLFERLALYGLLPYYLHGKNRKETTVILGRIDWSKHERKYYTQYKHFPVFLLRLWYEIIRVGYQVKQSLIS